MTLPNIPDHVLHPKCAPPPPHVCTVQQHNDIQGAWLYSPKPSKQQHKKTPFTHFLCCLPYSCLTCTSMAYYIVYHILNPLYDWFH